MYKILFTEKMNISFVEQNSNFFPGSLLENICFDSNNFNEQKYSNILSDCGLVGFDKQFPLGINTRIIENGNNLSGGQRQQLSLIRAMYNQPDFLLLDEPTSNIDKVKEKNIFSNLFMSSTKKSIVAVIHNKELLSYFDRIVFLKSGKIVSEGNLRDLLSNYNEFAELYYDGGK